MNPSYYKNLAQILMDKSPGQKNYHVKAWYSFIYIWY